METNLRARTLSETRGFVKALVEADSDRILGFTAFGVGAGEILAAVQIAMIAGLPYTALRDAVLTHPTLVEGLTALFSSAASAHNVVETRGARTPLHKVNSNRNEKKGTRDAVIRQHASTCAALLSAFKDQALSRLERDR